MKIKKLNEVIKGINGRSIKKMMIDVNLIIQQVRSSKTTDGLLKALMDIAENPKSYNDLYRSAIFAIDRSNKGEISPDIFAQSVRIANKLESDDEFTIDELNIIRKRLANLNDNAEEIGLAIINLDDCREENKTKEVKEKK